MAMTSVWELLFMLVVLKIPIVYLGVVVWWAIRAEPDIEEPETPVSVPVEPPRGGPDPQPVARARRARVLRPIPGGTATHARSRSRSSA